MAGLFGRGGGNNSNANNNSANTGSRGYSNTGSNDYNSAGSGQSHSNTQQSSYTSGGGDSYGAQESGGYNSNAGGNYGSTASYGSGGGNNNSSATGMNRSGSNSGTVSSVGTGSQFGSINDDQMERASISTFGGGTSIASGSDYQKPSGNAGISLGGVANELMNRDESSNNNSRGYGNQSQQQSGGGNTVQSSNNSYGGNQNSSYGSNQSQGRMGDDQQTGGQATPQAQSYGSASRQDSYGGRGGNDSNSYSNNNAGNNNNSQSFGQGQSDNNAPQSMGTSNASTFETTDHSNFVDSDPVAIAADFNSDTAEILFLSSEAGQGANRQPVTRFRIHEVNLNVHSNVLSEMADTEDDDNDGTNGNSDRAPITLEEDAATLKLLFGLMYNRSSPPLTMSDWQVVLRMARAAQKYDCARAKEVAAAYFTEQEQLGALSPFMTYAFAVQYKLQALEESAAERSVRYDIHRLPELVFGMMGFAAYQKLSAFHARRQTHYQDVLNNISMDPKELADQCYQTGGICVVGPWQKLKTKLAWPRQTGRDGSRRPPEPTDVLRKVVTEIGQIDCGTCAKALCEGALQAQMALTSMPSYNESEEDSF